MRRAIGCIALREARGIAEAGWIEEWMHFVDPCIDVADLDTSACVRPAARAIPGAGRIDDLMALAQNRMVECVVLHLPYHRRASNRIQRCSVKLDRDRVK